MLHPIYYVCWLLGQLAIATWVVVVDTVTGSKKIDPCIVHYPLRVKSEWLITAFAASITITPGTLSLTITDDDVKQQHGQRHLLVHAVYGSVPQQVLQDLAHMEQTLAPHVKNIPHDLANAEVQYPAPRAWKTVKNV